MTQARQQATTETKVAYLAHAAQLENHDLNVFRGEVLNFLCDQGSAEKNIGGHTFGPPEEIQRTMKMLADGTIANHSAQARNCIFLWNSFEQAACFHVLYNPFQEACESLEEWQAYSQELKAICKSLAEPSFKEVQLAHTFKDYCPAFET